MAKKLYIVSVYRPELLDALLLHVGTSADAKVILDRRHGERRTAPRRTAGAAQSERRRTSINRALREQGFAIVELDDQTPDAGALVERIRARPRHTAERSLKAAVTP
jgi:hypothetical protein